MAEKGLKSNVVGLFGGTLLGISSVAPAYVLTITLGLLAVSVGVSRTRVIMRARQPEFFRGETIIHESAHAMRPHEHLVQ